MKILQWLFISLLFFMFCIPSYATSADAKTTKTIKSTVNKSDIDGNLISLWSMTGSTIWELAIKYGKNEYILDYSTVMDNVDKYEVKYKNEIKKMFNEVYLSFGNIGVVYLDNHFKLFELRKFKNEKAIVVNCLGATSVLNTTRMNAYQRATRILSTVVLSYLNKLANEFNKSDIKYYIIGIAYGSKNFIKEDDVDNIKPEIIISIFSKKDQKLFTDGEITDQDLLDRSVIYFKSRDDEDIKRIKINIQSSQ